MVRLSFQRSVAPVLLFLAAVQAIPALHPRQDPASTTSSDISSTSTDPSTSTTDTAGPIQTGTGTSSVESSTATDASSTATDASTTQPPTTDSTSVTSTGTQSSTGTIPSPWISVNETDGSIATITPVVTTESDGVTSTLNLPNPTESAAPNTGDDEPASFLPTCDSSKYQGGGKYAPFCLPNNETHMWLKQTYYVTWDPTYWGDSNLNNTVEIVANYLNSSTGDQDGLVAFDSGVTLNSVGFITFYVDPARYTDGSIIHWTMKRVGSLQNTEKSFRSGPFVMISNKPVTYNQPSPAHVSTVGLAVGLPLAICVVALALVFLHFSKKNQRSLGGISIPSMRRKRGESGYVSRRSRASRGPRPPGYKDDLDAKAAAWEMGNMRSPDAARPTGPYQDEPTSPPGIRARSGESLPGNPFSDRYDGR
ncbi:hypothetical protein TWF694_002250 [Orbilia ellipsospora]|uniref:Mid2 domain-containing protein n=1 Tax=Orbilia ellipsospora TaxID=2528407 RepID=A0AAV9X2P2_9PEZI